MTEPTHAASELVADYAAAQLFERCQLVRPPFDLLPPSGKPGNTVQFPNTTRVKKSSL